MQTHTTDIQARLAGRATGAMFFVVFGGVWLEVWVRRIRGGIVPGVAIALIAAGFLAAAWLRYRRYAPALARQQDTPERRRAKRVFHTLNAAQWTLILVLGNLLAHNGMGMWVVPMGITVIGLHFVPLALVFRNPPHYVTAAALVVFAIAYPLVARGGPADPVGFLGAGLILWLSALWALRARG